MVPELSELIFFSIMEVKVPPYSDIQLDATWEFEKVTVLEQELYP